MYSTLPINNRQYFPNVRRQLDYSRTYSAKVVASCRIFSPRVRRSSVGTSNELCFSPFHYRSPPRHVYHDLARPIERLGRMVRSLLSLKAPTVQLHLWPLTHYGLSAYLFHWTLILLFSETHTRIHTIQL